MVRTSVYARNAMLTTLGSELSGGKVCGYVGKSPGIENQPESAPIFECPVDAVLDPASGSLKANKLTTDGDGHEGVIGWYRVLSANGEPLWEADTMDFDHDDVQEGAEVTIDSLVYTLPE